MSRLECVRSIEAPHTLWNYVQERTWPSPRWASLSHASIVTWRSGERSHVPPRARYASNPGLWILGYAAGADATSGDPRTLNLGRWSQSYPEPGGSG